MSPSSVFTFSDGAVFSFGVSSFICRFFASSRDGGAGFGCNLGSGGGFLSVGGSTGFAFAVGGVLTGGGDFIINAGVDREPDGQDLAGVVTSSSTLGSVLATFGMGALEKPFTLGRGVHT